MGTRSKQRNRSVQLSSACWDEAARHRIAWRQKAPEPAAFPRFSPKPDILKSTPFRTFGADLRLPESGNGSMGRWGLTRLRVRLCRHYPARTINRHLQVSEIAAIDTVMAIGVGAIVSGRDHLHAVSRRNRVGRKGRLQPGIMPVDMPHRPGPQPPHMAPNQKVARHTLRIVIGPRSEPLRSEQGQSSSRPLGDSWR